MDNPFRNVDLTDSFVLAFERHGDEFWIRALMSLTDEHPSYRTPSPEDYACYMHGWIKVRGIDNEIFSWKEQLPNYDPSGEVDFGSFDKVVIDSSIFNCSGDWGVLKLKCENVELLLD